MSCPMSLARSAVDGQRDGVEVSRLLLVFVDICNSVLGFRREFVHGQENGSVRGGNLRHLCRLGFTC